MPTRPPSRCAEQGCYTLTTQGRCEEHTRIPWVGRDDKAKRYGISSGSWRKLKSKVSKRDNACCYQCGASHDDMIREDPEADGFVLDHIVPIFEGGSKTSMDNLGLLCASCDEIKSKSEALRANQARHQRRKKGP